MNIPTTDRHIVIEAKQLPDGTWVYRAVTPALGWHDAQTEWDRLDLAHNTDRALLRLRGHYMVRHDTDPRWAHLPRPAARHDHLNTTSGRYTSGFERAAKDYGKSQDVAGRKGGWIYGRHDRIICQGWEAYGRRVSRHLRSLHLADGTTAHWALIAPFESEIQIEATA